MAESDVHSSADTIEVVYRGVNGHGGAERRITVPKGSSVAELIAVSGDDLAKEAIVAVVNGRASDLSTKLQHGDEVEVVLPASDLGREVLRHSTAHVLAQAVLTLWPGTRLGIGPAIEDGFYYDFELPEGRRFSDADLESIETRMRSIIAEDQPFEREEHLVTDGAALFQDQPFKQEIIAELKSTEEEIVTAYRNSRSFVDLCRGPHVPSTGRLGHFKLLRVAGAYWRGDENKPQLQRVYGTAFESEEALNEHLRRVKEAELRDHRKLATELDLFHFPSEVGGGLAVFHPKGALIRYLMEDFSMSRHLASGYQPVWTPHVAKSSLFDKSGHLKWYAENMYPPMEMEGASYYLKPMNCPMHILIYSSHLRSYKELPMRLFELGTVYRFERSGVLHGLARVRGLTQDDAHIFCTPDQLEDELSSLINFVIDTLRTFGLNEFEAELSTRPDKFVGDERDWEIATSALERALLASGIDYSVSEGAGAFYAPKVDVHLKDAIGRRWQVSTLQVDLQLPVRFDLHYVGEDNERHRPYMIHRALFGSVERFLAILLEHYAGALPTWLSPTQLVVLPVRQDHEEYAALVANQAVGAGLRATASKADEPLGSRIRRAKLERIPYLAVVGEEDVDAGTVGLTIRGASKPRRGVRVEDMLTTVALDNANRQPTPLVSREEDSSGGI
ncbi:MAG: threonine--tRNA ligase [Actinobacteria bacterium]|jgi:threonyl-tRNA synthetase|nr:threonine--tRNA ligase [Actinomycetota bacterium]MCL6095947.1 threonine--tRNA ligase [Actinomycetota bacterium]